MASIIERAYKGEVFEDDGWMLDPILKKHLWDLNDKPDGRMRGIYSPSSLAACTRAVYYARIGEEPQKLVEPKLRLIFDTGHAVHAQLGEYIKGIFGVEEAGIEVPVTLQEYFIAGSADVVLYRVSGEAKRVIDFKTISTERFSRLAPPRFLESGDVLPLSMKSYVWQAHAYMAALDAELYTLYYYNKNNSERIEFSFPFNIKVWEQIEDKIITIEQCIESGIPPERETHRMICPGCSYYHLCKPPGMLPNRRTKV